MVKHTYFARAWEGYVGVSQAPGKVENRRISSFDERRLAFRQDDDSSTSSNNSGSSGSSQTSSTASSTTSSTPTSDSTHSTSQWTTDRMITSFPSPTFTSPPHTTYDNAACPIGYLYWHCAAHPNHFLFDGCCKINPCQNDAYCPRWAYGIAAGQPNTYKLTVNDAFGQPFTDVVMASTHNGKAVTYTVDGPFATTVYPSTTALDTPTTIANPSNKSNGISGGAAAGISIGVVVGCALVAALAFFMWRRWRRGKNEGVSAAAAGGAPGAGMPGTAQEGYTPYDAMPMESAPPYMPYYGGFPFK